MIATNENTKHQREATKQLLIDLLKSVSGLSILLTRPAGSMYYPKYFIDNGEFNRTKFRRTVRYAEQRGYIDAKTKKGELRLTLKDAGHERALRYTVDEIQLTEPLVWDKKWRMVMFDIPEDMRPARNIFKAKLDEMGFAQVQKSSYVHPFPCHNEIDFIRNLYSIGPFVRLAILDKLEGEDELRKRFQL